MAAVAEEQGRLIDDGFATSQRLSRACPAPLWESVIIRINVSETGRLMYHGSRRQPIAVINKYCHSEVKLQRDRSGG